MLRRFVTEMDEQTKLENEVISELGGKVGELTRKITDLKKEEKRAEILGELYDPSERIRLEHALTEAQEKYDRVSSKIHIDRTFRKEEEDRKKREELDAKIAKEKAEIEERLKREAEESVRRAIEYERFLEEQEKTFYLVFKTNAITSNYSLTSPDGTSLLDKFCNKFLDDTLGDKCLCPDCGMRMKYSIDDEKRRTCGFPDVHQITSKLIAQKISCENCKITYDRISAEYMKERLFDKWIMWCGNPTVTKEPGYLKYDPDDKDGSVTKTKIHSLRMEFMELERRMAECRAEMCKLDGTYNAQM